MRAVFPYLVDGEYRHAARHGQSAILTFFRCSRSSRRRPLPIDKFNGVGRLALRTEKDDDA
jgi:hypothetical protein